jgi:inhibitor of KinA
MQPGNYHIYSLGENAITIEFGKGINRDSHQKVMALQHVLQQQQIPWIKDIIPAYTTLTIVFDAMMMYKPCPTTSIHSTVQEKLTQLLELCNNRIETPSRKIEIPVCYDQLFALDIEDMALLKNLSIDEIIDLHVSKTYRVYMIGFLPGFPYMAAVDEKLITPRLYNPRSNVPAGSVGIAGEQTGIYPLDSPGGWNIIGRTPLQLFDASKENPVLLQAGDEVSFSRISMEEFHHYKPTIA